MAEAASISRVQTTASYLAEEALCLLFGAGLTLGLFLGMAHFENVKAARPAPEIEDLRAVSAISEPPPPRVEDLTRPMEAFAPLTGIEIAAAESPVKLAVVPPDLEKILPPTDLPPRATIQFSQLLTDLRPKTGMGGDFQHIYQQNEVDQPPAALVRTIARVSGRVRDNADQLRVTLVLVIDTEGAVTSTRILRPSGNEAFDKIVTECVRDEWVFTPAVRKGRKVRCMVQQLVWYQWTNGSPYTL